MQQTILYQVRRYPAARNLIRGRPVDLRNPANGQSERMAAFGKAHFAGIGEDWAQSGHHRVSPSIAASGHDEKSAVMAPAFALGLDPMG